MENKIWLSSPHMGGHEIEFINKAFEENWIAPLGPNVDNFETDLQKYLNIEHSAVLSSGTAALHLALILLDIKKNDEVIVSSFTFSASVNPILYQCAKPIFIDSEKDTWNMSPQLLEKAIVSRLKKGKKPKAIILVHLYGMPAKIDEISEIANKYEIPIIEDAAESLGSTYKGQATGTFGTFGIFSFNGNKIITTSGGGALVSRNKSAIEKARFLATQARDNAPHYQHSEIGYNYRMSNIAAGIGRGQMKVLNERVQQRRSINKRYSEALENIDGITFLKEQNKQVFSNFWLTTLLIDKNKFKKSTSEIRNTLAQNNIESRPLWKPMHLQPVFKNFPAFIDGTSESFFNCGICLPSGSNLKEHEQQRVIELILS